jgi:hypothetical protein
VVFDDTHDDIQRYGLLVKVKNEDGEESSIWFNEDGTIFKSVTGRTKVSDDMIDPYIDALIRYEDEYIYFMTRDRSYRLEALAIRSFINNQYFITVREEVVPNSYYNDTRPYYGVLNIEGETEVEFIYDYITVLNDGYFVFHKDGYYGVMDENLNIIIDAKYHDMNHFSFYKRI